ncbi:JmjC domain-containing protein [Pyxidicoccus xibeiensis]|uniref:JmjC domain-containing protein n=1 Tax=Pyxidicoccus xibeiensis TaxID=2906759 RepID=UPI0020A80D81|nr:cupin domain-containing protein [Pyxidicoccus xibeiensis]MCP3137372.1 cupin domain-containing protein [Pyxidicoccus xibeiensis]
MDLESPERPLLEQLFPSHSASDFLAEYWPRRHLACHGPLERLGALAQLPELQDLERLLHAYRGPVMVALPDRRDEHSVIRVDAESAGALYRSGMALILDSAERFLPLLEQWLFTLALELGLARNAVARTIVYASPPGGGNSPHFDANANIVVQLRGTKRWTLAPNTQVPFPTDRWAMNMGPPSPELAGYLEQELPQQMPEGAEVIALEPGSVLFVPRGYWHSTDASEDTLALNFTYSQPTWADVVTAALRQQLLKDVQWRELADGIGSPDPERSAACSARLSELLHQVQAHVFALEARSIVEQS